MGPHFNIAQVDFKTDYELVPYAMVRYEYIHICLNGLLLMYNFPYVQAMCMIISLFITIDYDEV